MLTGLVQAMSLVSVTGLVQAMSLVSVTGLVQAMSLVCAERTGSSYESCLC